VCPESPFSDDVMDEGGNQMEEAEAKENPAPGRQPNLAQRLSARQATKMIQVLWGRPTRRTAAQKGKRIPLSFNFSKRAA
jgi:hypothetical protein